MIIFNLLPIYPLDGYRLANDLFNLERRKVLQDVIFYLNLLLILLGIIIFFMFGYYAIILVFVYLAYLNILNEIYKRRRYLSYISLMKYQLLNYYKNNNI